MARNTDDLVRIISEGGEKLPDRALFGGVVAAQRELVDSPDVDQSIGIEDLDPALADYLAAGLFNASFRDADPEDDTADYWDIVNGTYVLDVIDDTDAPGEVAILYDAAAASGADSTLASAIVPIPHGLDMGVLAIFASIDANVEVRASITWYEEDNEDTGLVTVDGAYKPVDTKQVQWLKIDRPNNAKAASFASVVLAFRSLAAADVKLYGVTMCPLTPAQGSDKAHDRLHDIDGVDDHTFPGGTTTYLRADGTFATPTGGTGDHGALTGLTPDDDHPHYALGFSQTGDPGTPTHNAAVWYDTDETPPEPDYQPGLRVYLYNTFR